MLFSAFTYAQTTISGTVTEASSGQPLPGVNVIIKNTAKGASTDFDGKFTYSDIKVVTLGQLGENQIRAFSLIGFLLAIQLIGCLSGKPTLLVLRKLYGISIYLTVFCTGSLIAQHSQIKTPALDSSDYLLKLVKLKEGKEFWTYEFKLLQDARYKYRLQGGLMAVVKKENALAHCQIGDRFLLRAQLSKIEPAALDHEFDFQEYYLGICY